MQFSGIEIRRITEEERERLPLPPFLVGVVLALAVFIILDNPWVRTGAALVIGGVITLVMVWFVQRDGRGEAE